ncbi:VOC family protein [Microbulbifer echini]|uniref:VOC family protein n=1 Tax=Microbulbifer echini TaxID=1529067 RepID=A0ABV4NLC8_9GAMM|nr:VOC family protein [uncultured Microbulbifer sp.]
MFSHIMVGTNDIQRSKAFYDAVLGVLGYEPSVMDEKGRCFYFSQSGVFAISKPIDGELATHANGGTIGFSAKSIEEADAWHQAGIDNGGVACEDPPGIREGVAGRMYIAYLRDPAGNKICALHRVK